MERVEQKEGMIKTGMWIDGVGKDILTQLSSMAGDFSFLSPLNFLLSNSHLVLSSLLFLWYVTIHVYFIHMMKENTVEAA